MAKLDAAGSLQWVQEISNGTDDVMVEDILQTSDGGYALTGRSRFTQVRFKIIVIKLDALGAELWNFFYDQDVGDQFAIPLAEATNGDLFIAGTESSAFGTPQGTRPFVVRLNSLGALVWARTYDFWPIGANHQAIQDSLWEPTTGNIYLIGGLDNNSFMVCAIDPTGALVLAR